MEQQQSDRSVAVEPRGLASRDEAGADTDTIRILLVGYLYFLPDTNLDSNIIEYKCKMNSSNSYSDIYSIYR
jgi:hypothetical protein